MADPFILVIAQKTSWVKLIFDNKFENLWKTCGDMLWSSYAPESVLNNLSSSQLDDSIRIWYVFCEKAVENFYDCMYTDLGAYQCMPLV